MIHTIHTVVCEVRSIAPRTDALKEASKVRRGQDCCLGIRAELTGCILAEVAPQRLVGRLHRRFHQRGRTLQFSPLIAQLHSLIRTHIPKKRDALLHWQTVHVHELVMEKDAQQCPLAYASHLTRKK